MTTATTRRGRRRGSVSAATWGSRTTSSSAVASRCSRGGMAAAMVVIGRQGPRHAHRLRRRRPRRGRPLPSSRRPGPERRHSAPPIGPDLPSPETTAPSRHAGERRSPAAAARTRRPRASRWWISGRAARRIASARPRRCCAAEALMGVRPLDDGAMEGEVLTLLTGVPLDAAAPARRLPRARRVPRRQRPPPHRLSQGWPPRRPRAPERVGPPRARGGGAAAERDVDPRSGARRRRSAAPSASPLPSRAGGRHQRR